MSDEKSFLDFMKLDSKSLETQANQENSEHLIKDLQWKLAGLSLLIEKRYRKREPLGVLINEFIDLHKVLSDLQLELVNQNIRLPNVLDFPKLTTAENALLNQKIAEAQSERKIRNEYRKARGLPLPPEIDF